MTPFGFYFRLDPVFHFAKYVLHLEMNTLRDHLFLFPLRICQFLPLLQICRLFPFLNCLVCLTTKLLLDAIHTLDTWAFLIRFSRPRADLQVRRYLELAVTVQVAYAILATIVALLMGLGLILCILFNFVSIKLYNVVPMPLYLCFPPVAVVIPLIIDTLLPFGISVNDKADKLKIKWGRKLVSSSDLKYIRRRVLAINPLHIPCGILGFKFFKLTKSIKVWFYDQILNYTITALLSNTNVGI